MFVHSEDEAAAAEEAGIDMICTSHDAPQFGMYNSFDELKEYVKLHQPALCNLEEQ